MNTPSPGLVRTLADRGRRPACGLASQLLNAGTNVVTAYVASRLLAPIDFGRFVIAFAAVTIVLAAGRGLIGATMMVHLPAQTEADRPALVRSALGFTLVVGLAASALLALGGFIHPVLWAFAPCVTVALLHDVCRYVFLSAGRTARALALDLTWALVQAAILAVAIGFTGTVSLGLVIVAWGLGALGGLVLFGILADARPTHPRAWALATRDVAGWFTVGALVGQMEVYVVLLLTGVLLTTGEVGGVRTVQLLAYQPAVLLIGALLTTVQPSIVRARHSRAALIGAWRRTTLAVIPIVAGLAALALLRDPLMSLLFPQYVTFAPLVIPMAVQTSFVALSLGPLAILSGLRQGSATFRAQLLRTAALSIAAGIGMELGGATGLVWALAAASGLAWTQISLATWRVLPAPPSPHEPQVAIATR